ncbi:MAG: AAA-like domain-containing protein [Cyanobacteriota bacterium]|nr:AAA-like domain-containing protein [Cyanobacteriota bacterium]
MPWDTFLEQVADIYQLEGDCRVAFLTRFAQTHQRRSLKNIAINLHISEASLGRRMREVYEAFAPSCPQLGQATGPTKFKTLLNWLQNAFRCVRKTGELPPLGKLSENARRFADSYEVATSLPLSETLGELYIERPELESRCYQTLLQPGALVRLKALRQMGKTSLINRVLAQLGDRDYRRTIFSLELADSTYFSNLDKFLRWFCIQVSRELGLSAQLDEYWDEEDGGSKGNCTSYFEDYLLPADDSPLVLCLDDVDLVFSHSEIYEDFAALLRSWHERAKSRLIWRKLRLAVVHSTEAYLPLDINQSPFNVGVPIELPELTREEIGKLARKYGLNWSFTRIEQLFQLVGGHPHLVQQAFVDCRNSPDRSVEEFLATAPTEAGIYGNYLRPLLLELRKDSDLGVAFKTVVTASNSVRLNPIQTYSLNRMGLVQLSGNEVQPRCELYRQYFRDRLGT